MTARRNSTTQLTYEVDQLSIGLPTNQNREITAKSISARVHASMTGTPSARTSSTSYYSSQSASSAVAFTRQTTVRSAKEYSRDNLNNFLIHLQKTNSYTNIAELSTQHGYKIGGDTISKIINIQGHASKKDYSNLWGALIRAYSLEFKKWSAS